MLRFTSGRVLYFNYGSTKRKQKSNIATLYIPWRAYSEKSRQRTKARARKAMETSDYQTSAMRLYLEGLARGDFKDQPLKHFTYCMPRIADFSFACREFERLRETVEPDVISYNVLLSMCPPSHFKTAQTLFETMQEKGLEPDIVTYNSMMHLYGKIFSQERALALLDQMIEKGVAPSVVTLNKYLHAIKKRPSHELQETIKHMKGLGIEPSPVTYKFLAQGLLREGKRAEVIGVLQEMRSSDCPLGPDHFILGIRACDKLPAFQVLIDWLMVEGVILTKGVARAVCDQAKRYAPEVVAQVSVLFDNFKRDSDNQVLHRSEVAILRSTMKQISKRSQSPSEKAD